MNHQPMERLLSTTASTRKSITAHPALDHRRASAFAAGNHNDADDRAAPPHTRPSSARTTVNGNDPLPQHANTRQATPALLLKEAIQTDWLTMHSSVLSVKALDDCEVEIVGDPDPSTRTRLNRQAHEAGVVCHWNLVPGASAGALHRALGNFQPGASGHSIDHVDMPGSIVTVTMTGDSLEIRTWAASCPDWMQVTWPS